MSASLDLYIDTQGPKDQNLVISAINKGPYALPNFTQNDVILTRIFPLRRNTSYPHSPFAGVDITEYSVKFVIGSKSGTGTGSPLVTQFTWSKVIAESYFYANIDFATAELATAIGSNEQLTGRWLEIELTKTGGTPWTILQRTVTIDADVIKNATLSVAAGQTPISAQDVDGSYLRRDGTGDTADFKIWVSPDGTKRMLQYLGNDGSMKQEPIT